MGNPQLVDMLTQFSILNRKSIPTLFSTALGFMLLATVAVAQVSAPARQEGAQQSWDNLKTVRAGREIQLVDQRLKSYNGTLLRVSDEDIAIQVGTDELTVKRADVFRVSARDTNKRLRNALIGLGIGAGIGTAIGFGILAATGGSDFPEAALGPAIGISAAAGAGLGAIVPSYPTLYRAERRTTP
jgi:hypothetical protein